MKRIKEFFVKLFGCKTPKEVVVEPVVVKEHVCVEDVKENVKEATEEVAVEEVAPVVADSAAVVVDSAAVVAE